MLIGEGHHALMRRSALLALAGAVPLAALVVVAQATRQWRDRGCAGVGNIHLPPCTEPAVWHWADVDPLVVVVGAAVGSGLALLLRALARRDSARRQTWGET
jgi:hypothetical protein